MAQNLAPEGYRWKEKTLSNLAIKGYKNAWVMRMGFAVFGSLLSLGIFIKFQQANTAPLPDTFVLLHGLGMFFAGVFSTRPLHMESLYSKIEDGLHSLLAYISSIILAFGMLFYAIETSGSIRNIHIYFLVLGGMVATLFFLSKNGLTRFEHGIIQRFLYSIGLLWILLNYNFLV